MASSSTSSPASGASPVYQPKPKPAILCDPQNNAVLKAAHATRDHALRLSKRYQSELHISNWHATSLEGQNKDLRTALFDGLYAVVDGQSDRFDTLHAALLSQKKDNDRLAFSLNSSRDEKTELQTQLDSLRKELGQAKDEVSRARSDKVHTDDEFQRVKKEAADNLKLAEGYSLKHRLLRKDLELRDIQLKDLKRKNSVLNGEVESRIADTGVAIVENMSMNDVARELVPMRERLGRIEGTVNTTESVVGDVKTSVSLIQQSLGPSDLQVTYGEATVSDNGSSSLNPTTEDADEAALKRRSTSPFDKQSKRQCI